MGRRAEPTMGGPVNWSSTRLQFVASPMRTAAWPRISLSVSNGPGVGVDFIGEFTFRCNPFSRHENPQRTGCRRHKAWRARWRGLQGDVIDRSPGGQQLTGLRANRGDPVHDDLGPAEHQNHHDRR